MDQIKQRCDECLYYHNIENRLVALEEEMKGIRSSLNEVSKDAAVSDEQKKMIFNMLTDIKANVDIMFNKIDELEKKPIKRWDAVVTVSFTAAVAALISLVITKIFGG